MQPTSEDHYSCDGKDYNLGTAQTLSFEFGGHKWGFVKSGNRRSSNGKMLTALQDTPPLKLTAPNLAPPPQGRSLDLQPEW
eukprot:2684298-Amphidinium_carterae.1